jgi:hypothetical protein
MDEILSPATLAACPDTIMFPPFGEQMPKNVMAITESPSRKYAPEFLKSFSLSISANALSFQRNI